MVNDSRNQFLVVRIEGDYAVVANEAGSERKIRASRIRQSKAKTGYTFLGWGTPLWAS